MKLSPNAQCPCGSRKKYKKCCQMLHKGKRAKNALELMKSRFSAYVAHEVKYLIDTHHPSTRPNQAKIFAQEIDDACNIPFEKLQILDFDEKIDEAFVEFIAFFPDGRHHEKSRFVKENGRWYYLEGEIFD